MPMNNSKSSQQKLSITASHSNSFLGQQKLSEAQTFDSMYDSANVLDKDRFESIVFSLFSNFDCQLSKQDMACMLDKYGLLIFMFVIINKFSSLITEHYKHWAQERAEERQSDNVKKAGRKPFDACLMFKIFMLSDFLNKSYSETIIYIAENCLIQQLLGIQNKRIPSSKTVWHYRQIFIADDFILKIFRLVTDELLSMFKQAFEEHECVKDVGKHVSIDATFLECVWRRDPRIVNRLIDEGYGKDVYLSKNIASHKDTDATWAKKNNDVHFGYKKHVLVDVLTRFILDMDITTASCGDINMLLPLARTSGKSAMVLYGDSAYSSQHTDKKLTELNITGKFCKKLPRTKKKYKSVQEELDAIEQKEALKEQIRIHNKTVTPLRRIVEFVFKDHKDKPRIRCIGFSNVRFLALIMGLNFNLKRAYQLINQRCKIKTIKDLEMEGSFNF